LYPHTIIYSSRRHPAHNHHQINPPRTCSSASVRQKTNYAHQTSPLPTNHLKMPPATNPPRPIVRPTFPPAQSSSSTNTSSSQSYSSTTSLATPSRESAPLPSPSSSYPSQQNFFGSLNQRQPHAPQQPAQRDQNQNQSPYYDYRPNREGEGRTAAETNNFLNSSALLAEAAKRAQMGIVMRDMDDMEL